MKIKKILCGVLALMLMCSFVGCGDSFDATKYVKSCLDYMYHGDVTEYTKQVSITEAEALSDYDDGIETEAQFLLDQYGCGEVTEETFNAIKDFYKEVYKKSEYTVGKSTRVDNDNYTVKLDIKPLDIFQISEAALGTYVDEFNAKADNGDFDETTDEEFYTTFATGLLDVLKSNLDKAGSLEAQTLMVAVTKDSSNVWGISDNDSSNIDTLIIQY